MIYPKILLGQDFRLSVVSYTLEVLGKSVIGVVGVVGSNPAAPIGKTFA